MKKLTIIHEEVSRKGYYALICELNTQWFRQMYKTSELHSFNLSTFSKRNRTSTTFMSCPLWQRCLIFSLGLYSCYYMLSRPLWLFYLFSFFNSFFFFLLLVHEENSVLFLIFSTQKEKGFEMVELCDEGNLYVISLQLINNFLFI